MSPPTEGRCDWCGHKLRGRQKRWCSRKCSTLNVENHRWTQAKEAAKAKVRIVKYECEHCHQLVDKVEVNHKVPCLGKHGQWGCHHHGSGLETLCVPCHRTVTNEQRAAGLLRKVES